MNLLQLDVTFPLAVLAAGAACLGALHVLELAARGWVRRQTLDAIAGVPTLSRAKGTRHAGTVEDHASVAPRPSSPHGVGRPQRRPSAD
jgi:hypothetical protein